MVSQFNVFLTICFFSCHFFLHPISKKTRTRPKAPPSKTVSVRTVTFRGPGAGICRRQLRWHQNPPSSAKDSKKGVFFTTDSWPVLASAFHETTVIRVPLGPSVFKNIIFSMMIGYFSVFSADRCAMLYTSFLSHLLKNLGKRPAVEPSDF